MHDTPCEDCPPGIMLPADVNPDDPRFKDFFQETFIELMRPRIFNVNIAVEVAVPMEVGQSIIDRARNPEDIELAMEDAEDYISDLDTFQNFVLDEINATQRVIELDGYDVQFTVALQDTPKPQNDNQ